ncbi:MAG: HEPN domain-containing protein [Calditrichaeota bacterium]|nr:HEPN domain-containing protein [Calditrichota bacterium]
MPTTIEWIDKAEEDFEVAGVLAQTKSGKFSNSICNHSQQCAEKYLKAVLQEHRLHVPKTHDLVELLDGVVELIPMIEAQRDACRELTRYATIYRYPGFDTSRDDAKRALSQCAGIRRDVRHHFGMESS